MLYTNKNYFNKVKYLGYIQSLLLRHFVKNNIQVVYIKNGWTFLLIRYII